MIRLLTLGYLVIVTLARPLSAQRAADSSIVLTGDGWAVAVHEPRGWHAHCCSREAWGANLVLSRDSVSLALGSGLIRVVVSEKKDENTEVDLRADMDAYSEQYADVRFDSLRVSHPQYRVLSRVFAVP